MAKVNLEKPYIDMTDLTALEEAARDADTITDPRVRKIALEEIQGLFNEVLQKQDIPPEAMTEAGLARLAQWIPGVSYVPGLLRTAVGEGALVVAGKTTPQESLARIKDAAAPDMPWIDEGPFSRPALPASAYTEKLGIMQGPEWSEPVTDYAPLSKRTAVNTGLDILTDPALLLGGLKGLIKKRNPTIESLTKQYAEEIANKKTGPTMASRAKEVGEFLVNPSGKTGAALEDWRFRDADLAAVDAGQRPVSQVWREGGKPGFTERGLNVGKEKIMQQNAKKVEELIKDVPTGEDLIARAKKFYTEKFGPEKTSKINFDDIPEERLQIELGYLKPRSELMDPLYDAEVAKDIATVGMTEPTLEAQKNLENLFRQTAKADVPLMNEFNQATEAAKPFKMQRGSLGGLELEANPPTRPVPTDILKFKEKFYGPSELNAAAKGLQGHAAAMRASPYNRPDPAMQVLNKTEQRLNPAFQMAEGEMAAKAGATARELQHETLANIDPAAGAESLKATKAMASLLRGGPFTSEAYSGPNPLSSRMNVFSRRAATSPISAAVVDAVTGGGNVAGLAAGKMLSSPWSVYGAQPVIRGSIAEAAENERRESPWYILNRDYSNRSR